MNDFLVDIEKKKKYRNNIINSDEKDKLEFSNTIKKEDLIDTKNNFSINNENFYSKNFFLPSNDEDILNRKPLSKNGKISPLILSKKGISKFKQEGSNYLNKKVNHLKNNNISNKRRIVDEINFEYEKLNNRKTNNFYESNQENIIEVKEKNEAFNDKEIHENKNSCDVNHKNNLRINLIENIENNNNQRGKEYKKSNQHDFYDYSLLQNFVEDIAYDDNELKKILEKSKYEK